MTGISEAFGYPFKGKDVFLKYLIWSVMFFVPVLGYYFMMGYYMKSLRENCQSRKDNIPDWKTGEALQLLLDGFVLFVIDTVYIFIPACLIALSILPFIIGLIVSMGLLTDDKGAQIGGAVGGVIGSVAGIVILCIGSLWLLIGIFTFSVAHVNYVTEGILSAFNIFSIFGKIFSHFVEFIIFGVIINVIGSVYAGIVFMVVSIPIIGQLIVPFIACPLALYFNLFGTRLLGDIFGTGNTGQSNVSSYSSQGAGYSSQTPGTGPGTGFTF